MGYLFSIAAGLIGGVAAVLLIERRRSNKRRRARSRAANAAGDEKRTAGKIEFSKLFLSAVLLTYFAGFGLGFWVVTIDPSQLGVLLAYVATPTAVAIGFYSWKAKAENVVKIKKANPAETDGMPVDLNNIQP
ncbi:hypothetical protein [Lawsonibacter sp. JLR.KK007]|jgi:hypothetical protein|uniref:hypothetical protein n=1 Tax=Lawsonibacter sp. JLR.KK007 TaxID=3114293 RepID=UPI002624A2C2|nr:hypothetical protein [uncultured Oscillibacter sp.]